MPELQRRHPGRQLEPLRILHVLRDKDPDLRCRREGWIPHQVRSVPEDRCGYRPEVPIGGVFLCPQGDRGGSVEPGGMGGERTVRPRPRRTGGLLQECQIDVLRPRAGEDHRKVPERRIPHGLVVLHGVQLELRARDRWTPHGARMADGRYGQPLQRPSQIHLYRTVEGTEAGEGDRYPQRYTDPP